MAEEPTGLVVALAPPMRNFLGRTPQRGVAHAYDPTRHAVVHTHSGQLRVTEQPWPAGGPTSLRGDAGIQFLICLSCRSMTR